MIKRLDMKDVHSKKVEQAKALFSGWDETLIWSCLQGIMGEMFITGDENVTSAVIEIGDLIFLAGEVDYELLKMDSYWSRKNFGILVPQNENWEKAVETIYTENCMKYHRYAIKKERDIFDVDKLQSIVQRLPEQYELKLIDKEIYEQSKTLDYGKDWVSQFPDYTTFEKLGLGAVILKDGVPVSGASSYTVYNEGIEIEIDTKEAFRRKGLALICAARLILECLKRGLYPSWDAQNMGSVHLAEKLGYHFSHEYVAYEINKEK